jgi:molybdopterin-guanine dinucleotide biosynthesis protein A
MNPQNFTKVKPTLSAVVLAGGQSRRMGQDKALLRVDGQPLLTRTCQVAAQVCHTVSVVTPWTDRYRSILSADVTLIQEPQPQGNCSAGPLVGFLRAWPLQSAEWVLLLACDLPGLNHQILRRWSEDLGTLPDSVWAYVPRSAQGWEPLCGFYRRQCIESLRLFIDGENRSFQRWLATIPVQPIVTDAEDVLFNCNTPEDWTRFHTPSAP